MKNKTRALFAMFTASIAQLNDVASSAEKFSVDPVIQQTIESHIQESSAFLQMINQVTVEDLVGETIGLDAIPNASRTNTAAGKRRQPFNVTTMEVENNYHCRKTDYDTYIPYAKLDAWAGNKDFEIKLRDLIIKSQALARLMIGFNGTHVAKDTDRAAFPLLEDVNIGWLQKYRDNAPQNVLSDVGGTGEVQVGSTGVYKNLDAVVFDAVRNLIDPIYRDDTRLRVIVGRDLMNNRQFPMVNDNNTPTEIIATQTLLGMDRIGGVQVLDAPYFPSNALFIQPLDNLSIYSQEGGRRRQVKDEPEYDRVTNYESSNDDYVVEYYEAGCLIENIVFVD